VKRLFLLTSLAVFSAVAHAEAESDRWFGDGLSWYDHPCGLVAFAKYGNNNTPEARRNYEITQQHPEQCSKLFP
jgi:hypothetical protein